MGRQLTTRQYEGTFEGDSIILYFDGSSDFITLIHRFLQLKRVNFTVLKYTTIILVFKILEERNIDCHLYDI